MAEARDVRFLVKKKGGGNWGGGKQFGIKGSLAMLSD